MKNDLVINYKIVAEEFDGEIVLISAEKGLYFSLQGAAMEVWRAFRAQRTVTDVLDALCASMKGADRVVLEETIGRMQDNELLITPTRPASQTALPLHVTTLAFSPPVVEVYSDLAELIAIDPVHEVDAEAGWPLRPANFPDVA